MLAPIISDGRIICEHILTFLPNNDIFFVVYSKPTTTFLNSDLLRWESGFNDNCLFLYEIEDNLPSDLIRLTEYFNFLYITNDLASVTLFEYTSENDRIEFEYPMFDGERDNSQLFEMIKEANG